VSLRLIQPLTAGLRIERHREQSQYTGEPPIAQLAENLASEIGPHALATVGLHCPVRWFVEAVALQVTSPLNAILRAQVLDILLRHLVSNVIGLANRERDDCQGWEAAWKHLEERVRQRQGLHVLIAIALGYVLQAIPLRSVLVLAVKLV
jgi:hypothetical protein